MRQDDAPDLSMGPDIEVLLAHDVTTAHREMRSHLLSAHGAAVRMASGRADAL